MDYEETDEAALRRALLALRICPRCRRDLRPVANALDVWGCESCKETWYLKPESPRA